MYFSEDLLFMFYVVNIFIFLISSAIIVLKMKTYIISKNNNYSIIKDFEKGVSFKGFLKELETLEYQSSLADIFLSGYRNFKESYNKQKYNYGAPILLAKTAMKEIAQKEIIYKNKGLSLLAFNSIASLHLGVVVFLLEIIENHENEVIFFNSVIQSFDVLIMAILLSLYSSFGYVFFKSDSEKFDACIKGYIEGFLKFMHKELILVNE